MNLVFFSLKTKGAHNFTRRLWTVFTRFGFTEARTSHALRTIIGVLRTHNAAPTFFIPAVVLRRHPALMTKIVRYGAEVGIHGYVHNDYRTLSKTEQYAQTKQAIAVFEKSRIAYQGFRNPYLGWTEEALRVFTTLGFTYESNEAVLHDVIDLDVLQSQIRSGYEKSLKLFQAMPCNAFTLRPHFEGTLLRIPTSIPDDEMIFDRLRITDAQEVGRIWSSIMQRVYDFGGIYTLNLHPERGLLCEPALKLLLDHARGQSLPVWMARLDDVAQWWKERAQFKLQITPQAPGHWRVEATCTPRATLLARHLEVEGQPVTPWYGTDVRLPAHSCIVQAARCPCIALSPQTPQEIMDFLHEQGYPAVYGAWEEAATYALYLDMPTGSGTSRQEQMQRRSLLVEQIEALEAPLIHFAPWPAGCRAALAISGDIDSITIQDFFLRILEVRQRV
ncbi:MAG: polysaccharide deacetylase family protein [Ktedonobacteraceae bacterium]